MGEILEKLLWWCGVGHIVLCMASAVVPKFLEWGKELKSLPVLLRQMFWIYAGYILIINFCFGIISILGASELLNHSFLAKCITLFIGVYWLARVIIQFFYFDTSNAPKGLIFTIGEVLLVGTFMGFTIVYASAFLYNVWIVR